MGSVGTLAGIPDTKAWASVRPAPTQLFGIAATGDSERPSRSELPEDRAAGSRASVTAERGSMKIFNKQNLTLANNFALKLGYNRALYADKLAEAPEDSIWGVTFNMIHEHKAGKLTDPHVRCMMYPLVYVGEDKMRLDTSATPLFVDVIPEIFEKLPDVESTPAEAGVD